MDMLHDITPQEQDQLNSDGAMEKQIAAMALSNTAFEARCQTRLENHLRRNQGRTWRCESCGEAYGAKHIYHNGCNCDECGGSLEEVSQ